MPITKTVQRAVADRIRQGIIAGRFRVGQHLKQRELAQMYGCSIIPIREALHSLAAEGLIVIDSQRGARVTEIGSQQLVEMYQVRMRLEGWAAGLAAKFMTRKAAQHIRAILDRMDRRGISHDEWLSLNNEFHDALYRSAGHDFLRKLILNLRMSTEPYLRLDLVRVAEREPRRKDHESGRLEHRRIFEACLRRDAKSASRASISHLRRVMGGIARYLHRQGK